jgi:uncharacterized membrane protein
MASPERVVTIAQGDSSGVIESRRFLVRDQNAFAAIWAAHAGPASPVPEIDFRSHMVAAVFAGERPHPGYSINVTGTRRQGPIVVVTVEERSPDPNLITPQIIVHPFHIVTFPRVDGDVRFSGGGETEPSLPEDSGASSTGLTPRVAGAMAYLAGPFSGALVLATEQTSRFVRFHAWQAVLGLGVLGTAAAFFLLMAFALLIVSPTAFWAMLWLAAVTGVAWVILWAVCLWQAYNGHMFKLPLAGDFAERRSV